MDTAVLAGGCFWCTEAVFLTIKGVYKVISGYTGGTIKNPAYREITTGRTGHAEAIEITYDTAIISYKELLEVFFLTHDPTTLNQQGADKGTQYRSAIFYSNVSQQEVAAEVIQELTNTSAFDTPIVTEITPLGVFYKAEKDHQNYYRLNTDQGYCRYVIHPKLTKLRNVLSHQLK